MSGNVSLHAVDDTNTLANGKVKWIPVKVDSNGNLKVSMGTTSAGERDETDATGLDVQSITGEYASSAAIAPATGATVTSAPGILHGIWVETTIGTAAVPVQDGGTTRLTIPIALPIGFNPMGDVIFETNIVVPATATSTGSFRLIWRPLDVNVTWAY